MAVDLRAIGWILVAAGFGAAGAVFLVAAVAPGAVSRARPLTRAAARRPQPAQLAVRHRIGGFVLGVVGLAIGITGIIDGVQGWGDATPAGSRGSWSLDYFGGFFVVVGAIGLAVAIPAARHTLAQARRQPGNRWRWAGFAACVAGGLLSFGFFLTEFHAGTRDAVVVRVEDEGRSGFVATDADGVRFPVPNDTVIADAGGRYACRQHRYPLLGTHFGDCRPR